MSGNTNVSGYCRDTTFVVVTRQVRMNDPVCLLTEVLCKSEHVGKNTIVSPCVSTIYHVYLTYWDSCGEYSSMSWCENNSHLELGIYFPYLVRLLFAGIKN